MSEIYGLIGGSGFDQIEGIEDLPAVASTDTSPWGEPSADFSDFKLGSCHFAFMPRHGIDHRFAPHRINYRANIMAFNNRGIKQIIAINAVGSMNPDLQPGSLVLPDQLIDYTWGRQQTYFDDDLSPPKHIDFSKPFSTLLHSQILNAASRANVNIQAGSTLAVTQGPRLETAAEIKKYRHDGCDLVGMTSMPEAALARELGIEYISICIAVNMAAGLTEGATLAGMEAVLELTSSQVNSVLRHL